MPSSYSVNVNPDAEARKLAECACSASRTKQLYILAGANGSGKSTISKVLLPSEEIVYVNPDDIARELNKNDPPAAKIAAGKETLRMVDKLLSEASSFAIESTLSGLRYVDVIKRAKSLGYVVTIAYVFVDSDEFCLERIRVRVQNGGHDVPADDVRRRYCRSKANFVSVYAPLADHWLMYYNGGSEIVLVAHGNGSTRVIMRDRYESFMEDLCQK